MDQKQTSSQQAAGVKLPFEFPTGRQIYDGLMAKIEPELLTDSIPHLDQKYAGESKAEHTARLARYAAAYKAYDKAYAEWSAELAQLVHEARREILKEAEAESRKEEEGILTKLFNTFFRSSPSRV